jgi:hypothetical protein
MSLGVGDEAVRHFHRMVGAPDGVRSCSRRRMQISDVGLLIFPYNRVSGAVTGLLEVLFGMFPAAARLTKRSNYVIFVARSSP